MRLTANQSYVLLERFGCYATGHVRQVRADPRASAIHSAAVRPGNGARGNAAATWSAS